MKTKKGYVYILTNPSFREDWVKIGRSSREVDVRSKELDNTAVPLPFEIYATIKTSKYIELEQYIHETLTNLANKRIRKGREFFNIKPEDALAHIKKLVKLIPDVEINSPDDVSESENKSKRTLTYKGKYIVKVTPNVKFYFMRDSVYATMIVKDGNRFIVKKGSHINPNIYSNKSVVLSLRKKNAKSLTNNKTTEDIEFSSPSSAGVFVCGGACNGKYYWRTKEGKPLNDFIKYNK